MLEIARKFNDLLVEKMGLSEMFGNILYGAIVVTVMVVAVWGLDWVVQRMFSWLSGKSGKLKKSRWHGYLVRRRLGHHILLLVPGAVLYVLPYLFYAVGDDMIRYLHRADIIYMLIVTIRILNAVLFCFLDFYSTTDSNRRHPL